MELIIERQQLQFFILKLLQNQFQSGEFIIETLRESPQKYAKRLWYPTLSGLIGSDYLCTNWKKVKGKPTKYFFITKRGVSFLEQNKQHL